MKKLRFKNQHLKAPKTYYLRAMQYWAKDSYEAHKQLSLAKEEIKQLKKRLDTYFKGVKNEMPSL